MVASWVVELYLDQINRALLEETVEASSNGEALSQALRDFLRNHVDVLDVNVTISLLASYGRLDDLMHYATYRQVSHPWDCILTGRAHMLDYLLLLSTLTMNTPFAKRLSYMWLQDNETVLEYLLQRGEASKALAVLRRPGVSQELVYKFAPVRSIP